MLKLPLTDAEAEILVRTAYLRQFCPDRDPGELFQHKQPWRLAEYGGVLLERYRVEFLDVARSHFALACRMPPGGVGVLAVVQVSREHVRPMYATVRVSDLNEG